MWVTHQDLYNIRNICIIIILFSSWVTPAFSILEKARRNQFETSENRTWDLQNFTDASSLVTQVWSPSKSVQLDCLKHTEEKENFWHTLKIHTRKTAIRANLDRLTMHLPSFTVTTHYLLSYSILCAECQQTTMKIYWVQLDFPDFLLNLVPKSCPVSFR